jgi:sulfur carrier protein
VNGRIHALRETQTLAAFLLVLSPTPPFSVAINEEFVPRAAYAECRIDTGDRIDIVHPTAGG